MVDLAELRSIAAAAARRGLDPTPVLDVRLEDAIGQDGAELLRVIVVIPDERFDEVDGRRFLNALVNVREGVRRSGDPREAVVQYATPSDAVDDGGS